MDAGRRDRPPPRSGVQCPVRVSDPAMRRPMTDLRRRLCLPPTAETRAMFAAHDESETQPTSHTAPGEDPVSPTTVAGIVEGLARALELHDYRRGAFGETAAHTDRVMRIACELTGRIAPELTHDPQL